jgi:hypothetical protein
MNGFFNFYNYFSICTTCRSINDVIHPQQSYEIFNDSGNSIIKLDLSKLDTIGSIEEIGRFYKNLENDEVDKVQQLWYLYLSMETYIKKYKSRQITLEDLILRLIKFKSIYFNFLTDIKNKSSNYAMEVANYGLDVLNVGYLFMYVESVIKEKEIELVKNTYNYYIKQILNI